MPPPSLVLDALLLAILPALLTAAFVMAATVRFGGPKRGPLASALGLVAGASLGLWLRGGLTLMPGESAWNHLPWAALGALWVGQAATTAELHRFAIWLLRAATGAATAWFVVPPETRADIIWLAPVFAGVILALWFVLEPLATEPPGGGIPFALALASLAAGGVLVHAASARLMDVMVVLASALVGVAAVATRSRVDAGGVAPAIAVMLPGVLLTGQRETSIESLSWLTFALPAVPPLMLAFTLPLRRWDGVRLRVLQLTLILLPLAAALILARLEAGPLEFD